eukprot:TRINITY_DN9739_c0_g2_i1.p1 TRINITY_DN9739_c0_g2~~TRINITY_DN9739_c0_g2_i1.p1  ORF type:complete len:139 (+),score=29.75 TRINITY_DN9739_c0_g2_i1:82-498(+)
MYLLSVTTYAVTLLSLSLLFCRYERFGDFLGSFSLTIEACLGLPQASRNRVRRSTDGLSATLIFSWTIGDFLKFVYFSTTEAPSQFLACAVVQIFVDLFILGQIAFYSSSANPTTSSNSSITPSKRARRKSSDLVETV